MTGKLEELLLFGIGSALLTKEKLEKAGQDVFDRREESMEKARDFLDQSIEKGSAEREQIRCMIKNVLRDAINELGLATKEDIAELKREIFARSPLEM
ncbi:MAG: hypothetical protein A2079_06505 [Geobacteraceae bacterium GWC2_48_7]|nr:MAG: hypothetical protein A2079_06505 [Geobacteraceae bacterium GWC2_48_7]